MFGQLFGRRAPQAPQTNGNVTETPVGSAVHVNVYDLWESNDSVVRHHLSANPGNPNLCK